MTSSANSSADDSFQAFADFASCPRLVPLEASERRERQRPIKTPRPFSSFFNGLHISNTRQLSSQSSTSSTTETVESEAEASGTSSDEGKRLMRRGSFILSSGADKYTFDSETVELPFRSIDVYEKRLRQDPQASSSHRRRAFLQPEKSRPVTRSFSHFSNKSEDSDKSSSFRSERSDGDKRASDSGSPTSVGGSLRRPFGTERRVQRGSLVRSARLELTRSSLVNGRYANPWDTWTPLKFTNILKFGFTKDKSNIPGKEQLDIVLPMTTPAFGAEIPPDCLSLTWIGHSTVVIQMESVTFITDPMFSDRASPSQMVGPKRFRDAACSIHDLPAHLDAVLISHNHYDHLDMNSVTLLNARFGVDLRWFVPQGLLSWFEAAGCENVVELDWWEENCVPEKGDVSFTFVPAQHWSKRTLSDDCKSLWGGWVVCGVNQRFYFAGDTGYCPVFKQIGSMFGPFSAAAIPIGAFEPRWFMKYQHVNPEEAVQIHQDVRSRFTLGVHWGTFALANEYYLDPPVKLREALDAKSLSADAFTTFKHGETRLVSPSGCATPIKAARRRIH